MKNQENKIVKLESTISMLQNHENVQKQQSAENVKRSEELEQYGRRLCLRFDGIPTVKNEKASYVLVNIKKKGRKTNLFKRNGKMKFLLCLTLSSTEHIELVGRILIEKKILNAKVWLCGWLLFVIERSSIMREN